MHPVDAGVNSGMTAEQVLEAGPRVTEHWRRVADAESVLDTVGNYYGRQVQSYVAAVPDGMALADLQQLLDSGVGHWLSLIAASVELHLNTDEDVAALKAELSRRVEIAQKRADDERIAAGRRMSDGRLYAVPSEASWRLTSCSARSRLPRDSPIHSQSTQVAAYSVRGWSGFAS